MDGNPGGQTFLSICTVLVDHYRYLDHFNVPLELGTYPRVRRLASLAV